MCSPVKFPGLQPFWGWALLAIATACVDIYFPASCWEFSNVKKQSCSARSGKTISMISDFLLTGKLSHCSCQSCDAHIPPASLLFPSPLRFHISLPRGRPPVPNATCRARAQHSWQRHGITARSLRCRQPPGTVSTGASGRGRSSDSVGDTVPSESAPKL